MKHVRWIPAVALVALPGSIVVYAAVTITGALLTRVYNPAGRSLIALLSAFARHPIIEWRKLIAYWRMAKNKIPPSHDGVLPPDVAQSMVWTKPQRPVLPPPGDRHHPFFRDFVEGKVDAPPITDARWQDPRFNALFWSMPAQDLGPQAANSSPWAVAYSTALMRKFGRDKNLYPTLRDGDVYEMTKAIYGAGDPEIKKQIDLAQYNSPVHKPISSQNVSAEDFKLWADSTGVVPYLVVHPAP